MSEQTQENPALNIPPVKVTRNEVELDFLPKEKSGRGGGQGGVYLCPEVTEDSLQHVLDFLGNKMVVKLIAGKFAQICQSAWDAATDEKTSKLDQAKLVSILEAMSFRGETKSELLERRQELMDKEIPRIDDAYNEAEKAGNQVAMMKAMKQMAELMKDIRDINNEIESKSRKKDKEEEAAVAADDKPGA